MFSKFNMLLGLGLYLVLGFTQGNAHCEEAPLQQRFQTELEALQQEFQFPGATAAFIYGDSDSGVAAAGMADLEAKTPMQTGSRMLAASVGKSFVAATVIALEQDGVLSLDDPLARWLGEQPWYSRLPNHRSITLFHLLTHTAGIPDHVYDKAFPHIWNRIQSDSEFRFNPSTLIEIILDQTALFAPGTDWAYTDTGYILLGMVIEKATGKSYYEEVSQRFLKPMALGQTTPSNSRELVDLVAGYTSPDNPFGLAIPTKSTTAPGVMAWNPAVEWTGGGLVSNAGDLARWAKQLYGGEALATDYLETLTRSVPIGGPDSGIRMGLGVVMYQQGPFGPAWGHGGVIPGYVTSMRYYPDHELAIVFQINTDKVMSEDAPSPVEVMEQKLAQVVLGKPVAEGTAQVP